MPYAAQADIDRIYGSQLLLVIADRDGGGSVDTEAVDQALADASALIDGYLGGRYAVPVSPAPSILMQYCVDIACYKLGGVAGGDERRKRYEDAMHYLERVSEGKISLGVAETPPAPASGGDAPDVSSADRVFSRDTMKGF